MTTISINSDPRPSSNGGISALIVSVGLVAVLGIAIWYVNTTVYTPANASVPPQPSTNFSEYRFVTEAQRIPLDLRASRTLTASRGLRGSFSPAGLF